MKLLSIIFVSMLGLSAYALPTFNSAYDCELMMYQPEPYDFFEKKFVVAADAGDHGGMVTTVNYGEHSIGYSADGKWLSLEWYKSGKFQAKGLFVVSNLSTDYRVAILYSAENPDNQISIGCGKR